MDADHEHHRAVLLAGRGILMRRVRAFLLRLMGTFTRARRDREFSDELKSHLAMHVEDNIRAGMSPGDARRDALMKLGGLAQARETYRDRSGLPFVDRLFQDVRVGARMLRRNPVFAAVAVLTLGLGVGANAAIFSVVNAVLLRPLPYPDAERLVLVWATDTKRGVTEDVASYPDVEDWKAQNRSFEGMAAFTERGAMLAGADQAVLVPALQTMPGFFETLGVSPAMGRTFRAEDQDPGSRVVLLSDAAWKQHFAGRADVLGQTLRVNEQTHTVIGVMPADFRFSPVEPEQIYTPLERDPSRNHGFLRTVARLRPNVSRAAAQADMDAITRRIAEQYPRSNRYIGANVMRLVDAIAGATKPGLFLSLGVVAMVLLIACANVANLLLSRNASRQRELAVRTALGASRLRLTQQLLTESLLIALSGGALGLLLATWAAPLLAALLADNFSMPRIDGTRTDGRVLGFTLLVSFATALLFGGLHAVAAASSPDLGGGLRDSGRTTTASARAGRIRSVLVIAETALALMLLAGAGSLLKSLLVMRNTAPGFTTQNLLAVGFWLPKSKLDHAPARLRFFEGVITRVAALPGARSAALIANLPMSGSSDRLGIWIVGRSDPPSSTNVNIVSPGYFQTLGIPMRAGRAFTDGDSAGAPPVVIINESTAKKFWPGENPLGRQLKFRSDGTPVTVVGVAGDVRQMNLATAPQPEIYINYLQPTPDWPWLTLVVRADADPASLAPSIKAIARSEDPNVPIAQMRTFDEVLSGSLAEPRIYTMLLGAFAGLALALAGVGLYGVVAYTASQRTHEMGIRQALGAARRDILRLVLRQGLALSIAGPGLGLLGAVALTRLLKSLVPAVEPGDPLTLLAVSALLMAVALAAAFLPAERASRVDPLIALRYE
jgi:predicted permease